MREEKANRQVAQIDRELSAKVESSERRASAAEHELKKTRQMLSDTQTQLRLLEQSMGDTQGDMMEQLKTLQHERQFADNQYQDTAEELRQKEVELARVESMLAQTVADGKRHTELYEQSQGKIHELTLEVEDLKGKLKAREIEMKSEKVDMEMMFDKQLAKAKSDHLELEEEIARLKDKISLLQEGLKAAGEATGNASGKLVNQVDELKRKCTALQDELNTTKEAATGKGTVSLRLLKAAYAAANNSYLLRGSYCKARAFHGWKRLKYHRKAAPYLIRYHRGIERQSKKAVQNTWQNWYYEVKRMKNARGCAFAAHKQKQDEIVDVCWSAFKGLLNERKMRNDYSKAWRSTFEEMEVEKHGSMQLSSDMENLRLSLGKLFQINVCGCDCGCDCGCVCECARARVRACVRACVGRFCIEHRELILNHVGSARARSPHRRRISAGAEFGAWRNSPTPSPRDGGRAEKGQTTKGHPHDGKMLYFSNIRMPMNVLQAVVSVFEPLTLLRASRRTKTCNGTRQTANEGFSFLNSRQQRPGYVML
jgi:hypothetical protein